MTTLTLYANPYDIDANGFYFKSFDEYQQKVANNINRFGQHVEEYEIDYIDGDEEETDYAQVCRPEQANLKEWFENLDIYCGMDDHEQQAFIYLVDVVGYTPAKALENYESVNVFEGTKEDYAYELIEECYGLPEFAKAYFDYDKFARDLEMGGDIFATDDGYVITNCFDF